MPQLFECDICHYDIVNAADVVDELSSLVDDVDGMDEIVSLEIGLPENHADHPR